VRVDVGLSLFIRLRSTFASRGASDRHWSVVRRRDAAAAARLLRSFAPRVCRTLR